MRRRSSNPEYQRHRTPALPAHGDVMSATPVTSAASPSGPAISGHQLSAVVIEVANRAAGILAEDGARYRFHSAEARYASLDGQHFRSAGEAERAARRLYANRKQVPAQTGTPAAPAREARR